MKTTNKKSLAEAEKFKIRHIRTEIDSNQTLAMPEELISTKFLTQEMIVKVGSSNSDDRA